MYSSPMHLYAKISWWKCRRPIYGRLGKRISPQVTLFSWQRDCKIIGMVPYLKHVSRFQVFPHSHNVMTLNNLSMLISSVSSLLSASKSQLIPLHTRFFILEAWLSSDSKSIDCPWCPLTERRCLSFSKTSLLSLTFADRMAAQEAATATMFARHVLRSRFYGDRLNKLSGQHRTMPRSWKATEWCVTHLAVSPCCWQRSKSHFCLSLKIQRGKHIRN